MIGTGPAAAGGSRSPRAADRTCPRTPGCPGPRAAAAPAGRPPAARSGRRRPGSASRTRRAPASNQASPSPQTARPPLSTSRVATILPRWATLRYVTPVTSAPSADPLGARRRGSRGSCSSPGSRPTPGRSAGSGGSGPSRRCASKPAASAAVAMSAQPVAGRGRAAGEGVAAEVQPEPQPGRDVLLPARGRGPRRTSACGTTRTGCGSAPRRNPRPGAPRGCRPRRSCPVSTSAGMRLARGRLRSRHSAAGRVEGDRDAGQAVLAGEREPGQAGAAGPGRGCR